MKLSSHTITSTSNSSPQLVVNNHKKQKTCFSMKRQYVSSKSVNRNKKLVASEEDDKAVIKPTATYIPSKRILVSYITK
jgi:hypothetical protein